MTPEQIYQKFNEQYHLEGNNGGIQKHKHYILEMMKEFAKLMCDKQKEICFTHALPYKEGAFGNYFYQSDIKIEKESILNAPYPDELQGNN